MMKCFFRLNPLQEGSDGFVLTMILLYSFIQYL